MIVSSEVLIDELEEFVDPIKSVKVREFVTICKEHIELSEKIIKLARGVEKECRITGADALHIASSAETKYFITCDGFILSKVDCVNKFMERGEYKVMVMNIIEFIKEKKWE